MSHSTCAFWSLILCTSICPQPRPQRSSHANSHDLFSDTQLLKLRFLQQHQTVASTPYAAELRTFPPCVSVGKPLLARKLSSYALFLCRTKACTTCCLKPQSDCLIYLFSVTVAYAMMSIFYQLLLYGQKQNSSHRHVKNNCYSCSDSVSLMLMNTFR